jgi:hypothetical protein
MPELSKTRQFGMAWRRAPTAAPVVAPTRVVAACQMRWKLGLPATGRAQTSGSPTLARKPPIWWPRRTRDFTAGTPGTVTSTSATRGESAGVTRPAGRAQTMGSASRCPSTAREPPAPPAAAFALVPLPRPWDANARMTQPAASVWSASRANARSTSASWPRAESQDAHALRTRVAIQASPATWSEPCVRTAPRVKLDARVVKVTRATGTSTATVGRAGLPKAVNPEGRASTTPAPWEGFVGRASASNARVAAKERGARAQGLGV